MPHYFFHLRDGVDHLIDPDGMDIPSERIENVALLQARDCMAGDIRTGHLDLTYRLDVEDADGRIVHTLSFADAVTIKLPPENGL